MCLAFFTEHNIYDIYVCFCMYQMSSFYFCIVFHCMNMPQFIHLPLDRHTVLTTLNKADMSEHFCMFWQTDTFISLVDTLTVKLLRSREGKYSAIAPTASFPKWFYHFTFLPAMQEIYFSHLEYMFLIFLFLVIICCLFFISFDQGTCSLSVKAGSMEFTQCFCCSVQFPSLTVNTGLLVHIS